MANDFIIGAGKKLQDVLKEVDLQPLFESAVKAGAKEMLIKDAHDNVLYHGGNTCNEETIHVEKPLFLEGEIAGHIILSGGSNSKNVLESITNLVSDSILLLIKNSMKSILATEPQKAVVDSSYDEILETNRKLKLSENKYRDLANNLEKKVREHSGELKQAYTKLLQQEKIASVGQLAAGVAHEINNPLGFISSNINTLKQYLSKLKDMLSFYRKAFEKDGAADEVRELADKKWKKLKLDYILNDADELISESRDGAERVKKIVSDLKGFSHIDEGSKVDIDINREIDRTLNVLSHKIPSDMEIERDYHSLPLFNCNPAHICQAFFNIILNALQAGKENLKLVIATRSVAGWIRVDLTDNGPGIPEDAMNRIFEPFYTTKEDGTGTGMGLNVAYETVSSYGGSVEVESREGQGATFSIFLPLIEKGKDD